MLEAFLRETAAAVLRISPARLDRRQPLSALGIDSLSAVEIRNEVEVRLGVAPSLTGLLEGAGLARLAEEILEELETSSPAVRLKPAAAAGPEHPLSHGQEALWYLHRLAPESPAYNLFGAVRVTAPLNAAALRHAFQALADRHEPLRTTFGARDGQPFQRVLERAEVRLEVAAADGLSEADLHARLLAESLRPFDLENGPLLRPLLLTRTDGDVLLLALHHIVADFWSLAVLLRELAALYREASGGVPAALGASELRYSDYVSWQRSRLAADEGERLWSYWRERLGESPPEPLGLATDRPRPPVQTFRGGAVTLRLGRELSEGIRALGRTRGTTLFMTLAAGFQALLFRSTGQPGLALGAPTAGRTAAGLADLVGYFVNPVVLRADAGGDPTWEAFLDRARAAALGAFEHQDYPFALLVERLQPERDLGRSPIFQAAFVLQKPPSAELAGLAALALGVEGESLRLGELTLAPVRLEQCVAQFDLSLVAAELEDGLGLSLQYAADLFDPATAERLAGHLRTLLAGAVAEPGSRLSDLPLLSAAERRQLAAWNETGSASGGDLRGDACLHELFVAQAARTPEAVAVLAGQESLTYAELRRRANQLAHHLRRMGVGPEVGVGVFLERSADLVVSLLGVLAAGGAYVPLDPAYPAERLAFLLEDTAAPVVVSRAGLLERLPGGAARRVLLDRDAEILAAESGDDPARLSEPGHLAYFIYTSGSTGRPKGVSIEHRSAVSLVRWSEEVYGAQEIRGVLFATSICFDLSVFELFVPLGRGGTVVVAENALELASLPAAGSVSLVNTVPSAIAELVRSGGLPASVRTVNLAGEPLQRSVVESLYALGTVERVYNLYGPSEDTTYSTGGLVERGAGEAVTIGLPLAGKRSWVLDGNLRLVPVGVAGELYLSGEGLARGYLNRPELTAERWVPDPLSSAPGGRLYRTGDLARRLADGRLLFLGRIDHQVKVRGFRIELGEVEAALLSHAGVREAVAVARADAAGMARLVAYVVPEEGEAPSASELREHLRRRLPEPMVPSALVSLASLPLTPNGKVDRKALPEPEGLGAADAGFVAPRTPAEELLAGIWSELLGRERVGIHDNFFELGGHSLLATRVLSRLRGIFGVELPVRALFESPTVAALASQVERRREEHSGSAARGAILPRGGSAAVVRPGAAVVPRPARARQRGLQHPGGLHVVGDARRGGSAQCFRRDRAAPRGAAHELRGGRGPSGAAHRPGLRTGGDTTGGPLGSRGRGA